MKHLGDITKIHGCAVPITDCVIGGSPCQDLSVAGKREGLAGARSGLFMEQIRIVKEMRYADQCSGRTGQFIRPRYMVWENVPGAFSSNKGEDFRAVLEEVIRIAEPDAPDIPLPEKGKWPLADCWCGDGWSVAYRVLDAQFWGVPQRRRRIALVADFGGHTAPEILFERDGLCWDSAQSGEARQGTPGDFENGTGETVYLDTSHADDVVRIDSKVAPLQARDSKGGKLVACGQEPVTYPGVGITSKQNASNAQPGDPCHTLNQDSRNYVCYGICSDASNSMKSSNPHSGIYVAETSRTLDLNGGNPACNQGGICIAQCYDMTHASDVIRECGETAPTLQSRMGTGGNQIPLTYQQVTGPLMANSHPGSYTGQDAYTDMFPSDGYAVRRLTPLECERLQGYPDGWTDIGAWKDSKGKLHKESSDSARYKALGNSIALPPWKWVLKRLCAFYERDATMASLFDGIGGFPLIWEQLNGKGSCLWASEIEEFPIAVTRRRFVEVFT